jgi:hypothetical protein
MGMHTLYQNNSYAKPDPNTSLSRPAIHLPASSPSILPFNNTSPPTLKAHPRAPVGVRQAVARSSNSGLPGALPAVGAVHPTVVASPSPNLVGTGPLYLPRATTSPPVCLTPLLLFGAILASSALHTPSACDFSGSGAVRGRPNSQERG